MPMLPQFTTAQTGPLTSLEAALLSQQVNIETWFESQWAATSPNLYTSVDLRNGGFKLAPIDTNLFPAGFNNLNPDFKAMGEAAFKQFFDQAKTPIKNIILIPENHTRNQFYLENVLALKTLIEGAGFSVRIGRLQDDLTEAMILDLPSGKTLTLEKVERKADRLMIEAFDADCILLNNDLSEGIPALLEGLSQPVFPSPTLGWNQRLKSTHFQAYQDVVQQFSAEMDLDPWLISPLFRNCGAVDFMKREGEDCLIRNARRLFHDIQTKYDQHGIKDKPFIVVKADAGTYGMGIMVAHDPMEFRDMNRKQRTHMSASKGHQKITQVILQEGVYSTEQWPGTQGTAEPVIYMVGKAVVGGFYRLHEGRASHENLNAPGMVFRPLTFEKTPETVPNRFYAYSVVSRLAALAAAHEARELT